MELEAKHGQGDCKCAHYREKFPDCACEKESVSKHSPGPIADDEILVRTLFKEQLLDQDGRLKPASFRRDPEHRGFSVDRVSLTGSELLESSKCADIRYKGYLKFVAARSKDIRNLLKDEQRLFCVYDSATVENRAHADICQNVVVESGAENRKSRMIEIAWYLREAFYPPQPVPPTSLD